MAYTVKAVSREIKKILSDPKFDRRAALVDCGDALLDRQIFLQDLGRVLDLAATGARQVATEQGLEHEHERIAFAAGELLTKHIGRYCPHL